MYKHWDEATSFSDSLGRTIRTQAKDSQGDVFTETKYDNLGRVEKTSNPYRVGETNILWTIPTYDELNRTKFVTTPDGAKVETQYSLATTGDQIGTVVTVIDQANKKRRSITNALGLLTRVDEPNDAGTLGDITTPTQPTLYEYDALNNLKKVTQGEQVRTFAYDALSRLKTATNPESGIINYTYDLIGNLKTKTDARNITTTYDYDKASRIIKRSYTDTTPQVNYFYDGKGLLQTQTPNYAKGKLTKIASAVSETKYNSFDNFGRVLNHQQVTDGETYSTNYVYNLSGALIEETYPSGRKVRNTLAVDGKLSQVQSSKANETLKMYANSFNYNASGAVASMRLGNGKFENTQFNSRLQPTQIGLGSNATSQNLLKLNFDYGGIENNGNVKSQMITTPTVGTNQGFVATQNYTYDSLNRLKSAVETIPNQTGWKQTFKYDRYGNREFDTSNNRTTTVSAGCPLHICNPSVNPTNNKLTGTNYDEVGNTKIEASGQSYVYDAENKIVKAKNASGATLGDYFYDGNGKRVKKIAPLTNETTIFIYDASGKMVVEYSTVSATEPKISYLTNDHLGSPRITTDSLGKVASRRDFMPFGEEIARAGNGSDSVKQKFTGYERDAETDLDFAQARYYNKRIGRFNSPDELLNDQFEDNPQSRNLYAYVRNNPLNLTDPLGMTAGCPPDYPNCYERDGKYYVKGEDGDEQIIDTTPEPVVETREPQCSGNNPCRAELPDSKQDWIPVYGSFRRMAWNIRCRETGGCDINKALYHFGMTAFEATPFGWLGRGAKVARAAPSILKTLCFEAGTMILTDHGLKPIEEIKEGDKVLSYNEKSKQNEYKTVVQTMVREAEAGRILSLKVEGEAKTLGVTGEHPFYARVHGARSNLSNESDDAEWVEAKYLQISDEIRKADGTWAKVESVKQRKEGAKVYNFEVADNHNYFVGQSSLLAHNNCDWLKLVGKGKGVFESVLEKAASKSGSFADNLASLTQAVMGKNASNQVWKIGTLNGSPVYGQIRSGIGIVEQNGRTMVVQKIGSVTDTVFKVLGEFVP